MFQTLKTWFPTIKLLTVVASIFLVTACKGQEPKQTSISPENSEVSLDQDTQPFVFSTTPSNVKQATFGGLVSEFIWDIYQDRNGTYYFGTNHDGLIVYNHDSLKHIKDGIGGNAIRAIVEDQTGTIWFGTSHGLTSYNGKEFTNYTTNDGLIDNEIWTLALDNTGTLWIGTGGGVSQFNGTHFKNFNVPKPQVIEAQPMLSKERVSDILIDKKGHVWFVNDGYGITKYNGHEFEFYTTENGLTNNNVADLFEDSQGHIWIGTYYGGVSKFDGSSFTNFTKEGIIQGIETYNFCEDQAKHIWFSAENQGVYRYDGNTFTQFTTKDGLATNGIQTIYEDQKGHIWFSSWEGLSLYDGKRITNAADKEPWTD